MSGPTDIFGGPLTGSFDPALAQGFQALIALLAQVTEGTKKVDAAGKESKSTWEALTEKARHAGEVYTYVVGSLQNILGVMERVGGRVVELTTEQDQLDAASARLGLNFDEAAGAAGRFVDETEPMAAASRLAEAGLRLTNDQLTQLTARASIASQRLGVDTASAFTLLTTAIESGSARALRPFGEDMVALSGEAHTAEERLNAFVETTRTMPRATDDARSSMERFQDSIDDAERTMAASFTAEITRLHQITEATHGVTADAQEQTHELTALGQSAAYTVSIAGNAIALVVAGVAGGILTIVGTARVAFDELSDFASGHAAGAHERAVAAHFGPGSAFFETMAAAQGRADALAALMGAAGRDNANDAAVTGLVQGNTANTFGRATGGAATPAAGATGDADFERAVVDRTKADDATAQRTSRGGGSRARRRPTLNDLMGRAGAHDRFDAHESNGDLDVVGERDEVANAVGKAASARESDEAGYAASDEQRIGRMGQAASAQREAQALERRYQAQRSFTERWEELHTRQTSAAQHAAEGISSAFETMGQAIGAHVAALVAGKESVGEALQGMLADTLSGIGKQAAIKGGMETAEGIAALAGVVTAGLAPGHFAAAGAYFGVAALAGAGGAALSPSAPAKGAAGGGGASPNGGRAADLRPRDGQSSAGAQTIQVNFGAPVYAVGNSRADVGSWMVGSIREAMVQQGVVLPTTPRR